VLSSAPRGPSLPFPSPQSVLFSTALTYIPALTDELKLLFPDCTVKIRGAVPLLDLFKKNTLHPSPVVTHLGTLKGKVARTCAAVAALAETESAHALMRSCLGPAKVQDALRTLPIRHTAAFAADVTATQRAIWDAVVGTPTSDVAWVQTTMPLSEGGCGVSIASDVAPVARLAGVMQFLARAEPLLGWDRQLVVPLATEAGLPDALNACLPPAMEPMARWTQTGKVELPDGDVRLQNWWSARLTQVKAAALLEVATGPDVPRLEAMRAGKAVGCQHVT